MILEDLSNPSNSPELEFLLKQLYGEGVSTDDFVETSATSRNENISLVLDNEITLGYIIWSFDEEKDEEEKSAINKILNVDELVFLPGFRNSDQKREIVKLILNKAKKNKCSLIELSLPSQSFYLLQTFQEEKLFEAGTLSVSKELERKTEFVKIYTDLHKELSPQLIELLVSKEDTYNLEIIDEPSDYKTVLERGYKPEMVSVVFDLENKSIEEVLEQINTIAEWQEFSISLIAFLM